MTRPPPEVRNSLESVVGDIEAFMAYIESPLREWHWWSLILRQQAMLADILDDSFQNELDAAAQALMQRQRRVSLLEMAMRLVR